MDKETNNKIFNYDSLFWSPNYVATSAWIEHIPFGFWIIEVLRPRVVVELGVHNGTSYFSFCQAVKTLGIDTACYGIDMWKGDEHAGFYGEEVFESVAKYNSREFSRVSTLIRSTFDEAKEYFIDQTIDLLHIDGLHAYEAAKHDFENWLPKISEKGFVILHDINVREKNFGVFRLWEELKQKYRHFQFDFGYGLGIVAVGQIMPEELKALLEHNDEAFYRFLRNIFSERGRFLKANFDNDQISNLQDANLITLTAANAQLAEENKNLALANSHLHQGNKVFESQLAQTYKLGSTYRQLLQKYEAEIVDLQTSFTEATNELASLKKENAQFKKYIDWYKHTYEFRSLLGVLKEKIKQKLKKKASNSLGDQHTPQEKSVGRSSSISNAPRLIIDNTGYYLNPVNGIETSGKEIYLATGADPFFVVDILDKQLPSGWYWLSIEIREQSGMLLSPKLYYDIGNGFNERDVWNLPKATHGKIESLVKFPRNIIRLRFDPSTIECAFALSNFHVRKMNRVKVFQIAVSRFRKHQAISNLQAVYKLAKSFFTKGIGEVKNTLWNAIIINQQTDERYLSWCKLYDTISNDQFDVIRSLSNELSYRPLFSIVMPVYNVPINYLKKAIDSVLNQAYENWEFCIADDKSTDEDVKSVLKQYQLKDPRIKIVFRETNGGISHASNSALELATGDYMVLLDHDDELVPHSLYLIAKAINENRKLQLIYSDEDKIDKFGNRYEPYFKTDWNKDLFYGQNMINHLGVYKLSLVRKVGGFRPEFEGSQDYDLALRCIEHLSSNEICHVPHVLYHWRAIKSSAAYSIADKGAFIDAGLRALKDHLTRTGQHAVAVRNIHSSYRVKWLLPKKKPRVSIIIPTKDKVDVLSKCVNSVLQKTDYENFEILIIDNKSEDPRTLEYLRVLQDRYKQVKVLNYKYEFNFSAIVNYGVCQSNANVIVLLNNDTEVINEDWLTEMVSQCMRNEIGVVGAKLYYPNGQIQHAGVFLYEGHPGNHIYLRKEKNDPGYFNKLNLVQNYSVVTAACLAIRRELYIKAGGFDEENLKVAYNDVDFCLKVRHLGYENLWTPFAQMIHHESLSRGNDLDGANFARFKKEHGYMLAKWKETIDHDPFFNPNLGHDTHTTQFSFPPRLKYEWQELVHRHDIKTQ